MPKCVAIATGGTGGHIIPAQDVGDQLVNTCKIIFIGVGLLKNNFINGLHRELYDIDGANFSVGILQCSRKIYRGFLQAKKILVDKKVSHVIGFGSYHTLPVILAAIYLKIPYTLIEPNVMPGKINRFFSRWANETLIHFEPAIRYLSGNVEKIFFNFKSFPEIISKCDARDYFGLDREVNTLLVFGGSQGAMAINDIVVKSATYLKNKYQIIHFTGSQSNVKAMYNEIGIRNFVDNFSSDIEKAWVASDLAICRSGAGAIREMLIYEKPAILIPYPNATDGHQEKNGRFISDEIGGGICINQHDLTTEVLIETINSINLKGMSRALLLYKNRDMRKTIVEALNL